MRTAKTLTRLGGSQADLSLRWAHTHFVGFDMSWLICYHALFHSSHPEQVLMFCRYLVETVLSKLACHKTAIFAGKQSPSNLFLSVFSTTFSPNVFLLQPRQCLTSSSDTLIQGTVKHSLQINLKIKWARTWQNQQNGLWTQLRLRSAWASAQSDQSFRCPHEETLGP